MEKFKDKEAEDGFEGREFGIGKGMYPIELSMIRSQSHLLASQSSCSLISLTYLRRDVSFILNSGEFGVYVNGEAEHLVSQTLHWHKRQNESMSPVTDERSGVVRGSGDAGPRAGSRERDHRRRRLSLADHFDTGKFKNKSILFIFKIS